MNDVVGLPDGRHVTPTLLMLLNTMSLTFEIRPTVINLTYIGKTTKNKHDCFQSREERKTCAIAPPSRCCYDRASVLPIAMGNFIREVFEKDPDLRIYSRTVYRPQPYHLACWKLLSLFANSSYGGHWLVIVASHITSKKKPREKSSSEKHADISYRRITMLRKRKKLLSSETSPVNCGPTMPLPTSPPQRQANRLQQYVGVTNCSFLPGYFKMT